MCSCTGVPALSLSKWRQDHAVSLDGFMYLFPFPVALLCTGIYIILPWLLEPWAVVT